MPANERELAVEHRLASIETKIEGLANRNGDTVKALKDLQASHAALAARIDRYQFSAKFIVGFATAVGGFIWFVWSNFGDWFSLLPV